MSDAACVRRGGKGTKDSLLGQRASRPSAQQAPGHTQRKRPTGQTVGHQQKEHRSLMPELTIPELLESGTRGLCRDCTAPAVWRGKHPFCMAHLRAAQARDDVAFGHLIRKPDAFGWDGRKAI